MILFYVEFDNGDSNCYQGVRVPSLEEARAFCKKQIDDNPEWTDVVYVDEIDREQAEKFWDLSCHKDADWPTFNPEGYAKNDQSNRPFAYVCSPLRGDTEANIERAREYSRQVFEAGYNPVCPQIFYTQFLRDDVPEERAAGMDMGMALLPICRALVICGDEITEGMRQEVVRAQKLGVETCALANIPPIPTLSNYRNDLTGLENLNIAVSLIEEVTGGRFKFAHGDSYIQPDDNSHIAINKLMSFTREDMMFRVYFSAHVKKMEIPMDVGDLQKLQQEIVRTYELLNLLGTRKYKLTPDEMLEFNNAIRQRGEPDAVEDKTSVLGRITAAREQPAGAGKPKRGRPRKTHEEER